MQKVKYEIDPYNRLVIRRTNQKTLLQQYRIALNGQFKIEKDNVLSYRAKAPLPKHQNIPHHINLKGEWSLDKNHNLVLTLDRLARETLAEKLTLQGSLIETGKNSLLFAVTTKSKEGTQSTYILKLKGLWQADKYNRLIFMAESQKGKYDILTFSGAWNINKRHELIYSYEKADLIRKSTKIHTLTFKGHWDIKEKSRISYVIDKSSDSVFNFTTGIGIFKDKYIKYEVGIGLFNRIERSITLYGKWRIDRKTGLIFDIKYGNGKIYSIGFTAETRLSDKDTLLFKLTKEINEGTVGRLEVKHKILKGDGEAYLRLLKTKRGSALFIGAGHRW